VIEDPVDCRHIQQDARNKRDCTKMTQNGTRQNNMLYSSMLYAIHRLASLQD